MARNVGISVENAFTKGLITEVTGVNSPENSVTETNNVSYDRRGRASKRMGFDYEIDHVLNPIDGQGVHIEYLWETVSDNTAIDFVVVQIGSKIHFYESTMGQGALSTGLKSFSVDLLAYKTSQASEANVRDNYSSFTSGKGNLFVAHPFCETIRVSYDTDTDTIEVNTINIRIRDLEGVEDGLAVDARPNVLSPEHNYNLLNQGWYATAQTDDGGTIGSVLYKWIGTWGNYPSNKDVWWHFLDTSSIGREYFNTSLVGSVSDFYGNTPSAKGHYILNAFELDRGAVSGLVSIPSISSNGQRPSVVSFYAGRAFYSGVGKSGFSQNIYFSQIIENDTQYGECYQKNDPTSRSLSDLLDDDGGVIKIPDINSIFDLRVVGESLMVFASNGVWSISGTDNGPFKATDYTVAKISAFPAINRSTVAMVSGVPIWWNYEGIFILKTSDVGLTKEVSSLSAQTIQSFYDDISPRCKERAKGVFNDQLGLIYWLYSDDPLTPENFTNILILDAITGAFYVYTLPDQGPSIVGIVAVRSVREELTDDFVTTNVNELVLTQSNDTVITRIVESIEVSNKIFKFVTADGTNLTFSEIRSGLYLDWGLYSYPAEFITGYRVRGELMRKSQSNYLTVITEDLDGSSCFVQALWDYSSDQTSHRESSPQQVYRNRTSRDYQRSRVKIRGNGHSVQYRFYGMSGAPFTIVGWASYDSVSGAP